MGGIFWYLQALFLYAQTLFPKLNLIFTTKINETHNTIYGNCKVFFAWWDFTLFKTTTFGRRIRFYLDEAQ